MEPIRLGLIGFGVVGAGVGAILRDNGPALAARIGRPLELVRVAARDLTKKRPALPDGARLTGDPFEVVNDPSVDIVIEVMGGENPAFDLCSKAVANKKHFVTANKLLLALRGEEVYRAVEQAGVELGFEAAVAGAVPVIRALRDALAADTVEQARGIVNGTGNYILSRMTDERVTFAEALKGAQELGYAEADPTLDVEGIDSAHKIAILAALAFETPVDFSAVYTEGITRLTPEDITMAGEFGYRVKLLAIARRVDGQVDLRVHPAMIPARQFIANVNGPFNAVEIVSRAAGANMLVGRGAGSGPTASAVMGDVVDIARNIVKGGAGKRFPMSAPAAARRRLPARPISELVTEYYLRFTVPDRPGVLAELAGALGRNGISISSMIQRGRQENEPVSVVMLTHKAREADLDKALAEIGASGLCAQPTMRVRIANDERA